jgi:hypothetical protein
VGSPASRRIARVRRYSRTDQPDDPDATTRLSRSVATLSRRLRGLVGHGWRTAARLDRSYNPARATPAGLTPVRFGLAPVRSPLLRGYFLFLGVHEMFQFPRCPPSTDGNDQVVVGLPHSEIVGSTPARGSPTLIAALPRPSSARSAEASTLCSSCLPCWKTWCLTRHHWVGQENTWTRPENDLSQCFAFVKVHAPPDRRSRSLHP